MEARVVAFANDADLYCVSCGRKQYTQAAVDDVIWSRPGYEHHRDHEGNPLNPLLSTDEALIGQHCCSCGTPLDEE